MKELDFWNSSYYSNNSKIKPKIINKISNRELKRKKK